MEAFPLDNKFDDSNEKALKCLSEAFGSFSLEDIKSAYCKANQNADLAGEILYAMQQSASASLAIASNGKTRYIDSSRPLYGDNSEMPYCEVGKSRAPKQKWRPVSGGTVSSILGKDYVKAMPAANGACMGTKPIKLDAKEWLMSELWGGEPKMNPSMNDHMQKDIEDFLFRMLGDGFQLERGVIHQVLDKCGYDMQKSMDKLLDMPVVSSDEGNKYPGGSTEKIFGVCSISEGPTCQKKNLPKSSQAGSTNGTSSITNRKLPQEGGRNDLQKEVLVALFNAADRAEGLSRRKARATRRSRALGDLVVEPPRDFISEQKSDSADLKLDNDEEDGEDSYQQLRIAVKEYRVTMKEYYKAAVNAFAKGDHDLAVKLMEKGHFFHEKARKADEESSQKIFETKHVDTQDEVMLDLHDHGAKEAMHLLKCHLSTLSGIASIKYLKVIIETNGEDTSKGARRRWVMKLLEKESIKWTETENAGTIIIRLDNINRKALSFAKT